MSEIKLSVLDIERKYEYEYEETTYSSNSIVSYGKDNAAPVLFKNCYRNSATLKSIIDGSVNYILGDSIEVNDNAFDFKEQVNRNGMTMRQFVANLALSYEIYGGFAFQVIYNKLGVVKELFPLDFSRCRTNESGSKIYYSKKKWTKSTVKAEEFDRFNPKTFDTKRPTQVFYYKGDFTTNVYPLPPYYAAIKDILTEIECGNYSLNSVANGFSARYVFNLPETDAYTDEQKRAIEESIKNKFCGSDNDANFMLYWQNGETPMSVLKIESDDAPQSYINIKDNARQNIFISMRATPLLFGLPNAANGFSTSEYSDSYKLYQKSVIAPIQDIIKESIDKVLSTKDAITITPYLINFDNE